MNQQERDKKKIGVLKDAQIQVQCILLLLNFGREELIR